MFACENSQRAHKILDNQKRIEWKYKLQEQVPSSLPRSTNVHYLYKCKGILEEKLTQVIYFYNFIFYQNICQ